MFRGERKLVLRESELSHVPTPLERIPFDGEKAYIDLKLEKSEFAPGETIKI